MDVRVLIAAEHASAKFGGEAVLPLHYFRVLRRRKIECWLVVHERSREELEKLFPHDNRITYIADTFLVILLFKFGRFLPARLAYFSTGFVMRILTQLKQRQIIRKLIRQERVNIVHQPIPVSPKEPSLIYGMGVPVIIGPMNGGMDYPVAFKNQMQGSLTTSFMYLGRAFAGLLNLLFPGKRRAALLLVANERTRQALPRGSCKQIIELVENGVDLSIWNAPATEKPAQEESQTRFAFLGRLVDWKAVDLLLLAFEQAAVHAPISLAIVGDGPERESLEKASRELGIFATEDGQTGKVAFTGWLTQDDCALRLQESDVLVLPSLMECGGAVVLEAMSMQMPVIATNWGGPADYLDDSCGILIDPSSRDSLIQGFADAMVRLAQSPDERKTMGMAGQTRVLHCFDWEVKVDRMVRLYRDLFTSRIE